MDTAICSLTSKSRVHHILALYESMMKSNIKAQLFIFCVDKDSYFILKKMELHGTNIIDFSEPEEAVLKGIKNERKQNEYCWTLKPVALLYIFDNYCTIDQIIYADGDIYFFADPMVLIKRIKRWSVILTTHKINEKANGGFVCFRRDKNGLEALNWWKEQCISWCYAYNDNGNFGDQGHLDKLKRLYKNVYYLKHPGMNTAPWNQKLYDIKVMDGIIYINDFRLIFFHFSGLRMLDKEAYTTCWKYDAKGFVYDYYIEVLRKKINEIEMLSPGFSQYFFSDL
ncbi:MULTISPECIES: hypothetical protein [Lutispora]|uniref:Nucleotide-diphospho-sugar transferase domain-containing protein n=2 Tax=root TaxID=1 RepID=A0ABT1ND50_9FIRM|nr:MULTISPECIES: hypothetical protein [Lutispora]MCQ1528093.1 hypothetical protein [Lutispora saccharofermentans]MEA4962026.1 hypothetical protein [Lutispora sp.]